MLYFVDYKGVEVTWYIGRPKPLCNSCTEVQADGHELEKIRRNFQNLPIPAHQAVVTWKGDLAQFIYDNL